VGPSPRPPGGPIGSGVATFCVAANGSLDVRRRPSEPVAAHIAVYGAFELRLASSEPFPAGEERREARREAAVGGQPAAGEDQEQAGDGAGARVLAEQQHPERDRHDRVDVGDHGGAARARLAGLDPRATMGASLALASLILLPWAALDLPHRAPSAGGIGAVVVLGLLCTAAGFVVYAILIGEAGTSRATVITYVNPVVAVTLGVLLLGEHPGAGAVAGLLLILAGGWLATDGRLPPGLPRLLARRPRPKSTLDAPQSSRAEISAL